MRFLSLALAALTLSACALSPSLPHPQTLPTLEQSGLWFKLEQTDASGNAAQTSLLAVEQLPEGIRFVQTDALGAPVSRQFVGTKGWKNDGFIMPNSASRRRAVSRSGAKNIRTQCVLSRRQRRGIPL